VEVGAGGRFDVGLPAMNLDWARMVVCTEPVRNGIRYLGSVR
jgi:hypothetical protein